MVTKYRKTSECVPRVTSLVIDELQKERVNRSHRERVTAKEKVLRDLISPLGACGGAGGGWELEVVIN